MDRLPAAIVAVLDRMFAGAPRPLPLHQPEFSGNEWTYVKDCIDTGWVSSVGSYVDRFERDLAAVCEARHAVAVVNGTAALHVALLLAGVRPGDEVLMPALTFVATANAVSYAGAVPHLVEISPASLGVDPAALGDHLAAIAEPGPEGARNRLTGRRIGAVVPVHIFGHPVEMAALNELAARHGIPVVEDATEALGSRDGGVACGGGSSRLAVLSFNGNKIATCGGGGAILTCDENLARRAKHLTTTAKRPHRWEFQHDEVGFNYRLPNLNAALGCAQIERIAETVRRKRRLADAYGAAFADVRGVRVFTERPGTLSNYWLNAILLERGQAGARDAVLQATCDAGFLTRPVWTPMHRLPMYAECPRMPLDVTEDIAARLINLPSSAALAEVADAA